ncbi:hypothetical protein ACFL2H_12315 [Planctomycetota bacterium]
MIRKLFASLTAVMLMSISSMSYAAGCAGCDDGCAKCCDASECCNDGCCQEVCCPECQLKVDQVDIDKHCWKVECKKICVPRFVFPWQKTCCDPCANNGACTREVLVLKKHKYKCKGCEYSWTPTDPTCDCDKGCCDGGCATASCCDSCATGAVLEGTVIEGAAQPAPAGPEIADPAVDVPPAPPAPSASVQRPLIIREAKVSKSVKASRRTSALQTALRKLRK